MCGLVYCNMKDLGLATIVFQKKIFNWISKGKGGILFWHVLEVAFKTTDQVCLGSYLFICKTLKSFSEIDPVT